jgi:hypothetical protein
MNSFCTGSKVERPFARFSVSTSQQREIIVAGLMKTLTIVATLALSGIAGCGSKLAVDFQKFTLASWSQSSNATRPWFVLKQVDTGLTFSGECFNTHPNEMPYDCGFFMGNTGETYKADYNPGLQQIWFFDMDDHQASTSELGKAVVHVEQVTSK